MARIAQQSLFCWQEIEELGDLERLQLPLENLPDEPLMCELEARRGNGRDDYPIRALWNSLLSCIVFQHVSIESLRRELKRNDQLRRLSTDSMFLAVRRRSLHLAFTPDSCDRCMNVKV